MSFGYANQYNKNQPFISENVSLQMVKLNDGDTAYGVATSNLWVDVAPFSKANGGNEVTPYTTGQAYYSDLKDAIRNAATSICIAGWQVNWDAQLDAEGTRLIDVLMQAADQNKSLKIYVMPWSCPSMSPSPTYDEDTKEVVKCINDKTGNQNAFVRLAHSHPDEHSVFYSHHQKQVVIDGATAFVGGMDLSYGRFDDANYDLQADAKNRNALNRYNGCVTQVGNLDHSRVIKPLDADVDVTQIKQAINNKKILQAPAGHDYKTLDPSRQPRMPWQDVHLRIKGPSATDLALNFALRWNSCQKDSPMPLPPPVSYTQGKCLVQVLRSAPLRMCNLEYDHLPGDCMDRIRKPEQVQDNNLQAMLHLIQKSMHFIYIEQQFFVSDFGIPDIAIRNTKHVGAAHEVGGFITWMKALLSRLVNEWASDTFEPPQNGICKALGDRIDQAIMLEEPYHVYITLPVHPEGQLNDPFIITQVHWTMQTLVFASQSLLNRIRRSLKALELIHKDDNWERVYRDDNTEYLSIDFKKCFDYVTLLNLRNWKNLGSEIDPKYVTEQIYIHSKVMIVDDLYALVGSANINDRSLLGRRDSELGVLIADTATADADICGTGDPCTVRKTARDLRMALWKKIFGFTAGGGREASDLQDAIEKPGAPASWKKIQEVAGKNTELYEAAFDFIPRNEDAFGATTKNEKGLDVPAGASIWPTHSRDPMNNIDPDTQQPKYKPMPFEKEFWAPTYRCFNTAAAANLKQVKGFITLFPYLWTKGENNNMNFAVSAVALNEDKLQTFNPVSTQLASEDKTSNTSKV